MSTAIPPSAVSALDVAPRKQASVYPEPFASRMAARQKRALGDYFGLRNFGVNLTRLEPGGVSALRHAHSKQDEFVYVVQGCATLVCDRGEFALSPGMCAGFRAGSGEAHHLVNRGTEPVLYLEVGDRTPGDEAFYPDDDIHAGTDPSGQRRFTHKDGTPY
jgi:uncharacterized cupin superfamily protein